MIFDRLRTIPVAIPQNVALVDAHRSVTVRVGPDIQMTRAHHACAAHHQHLPVPDEQERTTRTQARLAAVQAAGVDVPAMLRPPLYQCGYDQWSGTVYTAHYHPAEGRVLYHWPGEHWEHTIAGFTPGSRTIALGLPGAHR
ncbi:hypothetical protein ACIBK8_07260 [Streptomyces sp. NPDC050161]|uniref:hypothetical protein n=1 Tax=Streptomyces sp. NPDC050161 TaxID=3365604 RepID=UPI0037A20557